jgi:N-acetylneuraminic acid mutarotase
MVRDFYRFAPNDATEVDSLGHPMGKWEEMAPLPEGANRRSATGFSLNGVGYIATGVTSNAHSRGVYAYFPETNIWERKTDLPGTPRQKAAAFTIGNRAYIAAGTNSDVGGAFPTFKDLWEYHPENDTWLQKADIGFINLDSPMPFSLKGKAYMYGGFITEHIESISHYVRVYTPEKEIFESAQ